MPILSLAHRQELPLTNLPTAPTAALPQKPGPCSGSVSWPGQALDFGFHPRLKAHWACNHRKKSRKHWIGRWRCACRALRTKTARRNEYWIVDEGTRRKPIHVIIPYYQCEITVTEPRGSNMSGRQVRRGLASQEFAGFSGQM